MITIEVCWIDGLDEQNLNIAKCILKLKQVGAFYGTDTWIRINPNYVRILDYAQLIHKSEENKSFVQLTEKGQNIQIFNDHLDLSLKEFFVFEDRIEELIQNSFHISVPKSSYKIMHNNCHCCGLHKVHLNHIVDKDKNDGMYCNQCLNTVGYVESQLIAKSRRWEAKNDFGIRKNS